MSKQSGAARVKDMAYTVAGAILGVGGLILGFLLFGMGPNGI